MREGEIKKYRQALRQPGQGKLRLGTILDFSEGIYSILYIATLRREYFKLALPNEVVKIKIEKDANDDI
jgi:hypothetical protein